MMVGAEWSAWTNEESNRLRRACEDRKIVGIKSWEAIAADFPGRNANACRARWKAMCTKSAAARGEIVPNGRRAQLWTQDEARIALDTWQEFLGDDADTEIDIAMRHRVVHRIADQLDRDYGSVSQRLKRFGPTFGFNQISRKRLSPEAVADRDARYAARARRTLTGNFFGDPPVGFSALDQKQQEGRRL